MIESSWKTRASAPVGEVMAALLAVQPLLDVLSYFMGQADANWLTTGLRTALLAVVCLYGFAITENRRAYYLAYGVVGGFWVLHMLNSLRLGYQDPVGDMGKGVERAYRSFQRAGVKDVSCKLYHGLRHEILNEKSRRFVYQDVLDWLSARLEP